MIGQKLTNGVMMLGGRGEAWLGLDVGVAQRDGDVPPQSFDLGALHRTPLQHGAPFVIRTLPEIDERGRVETATRLPRRIRRVRRRLVVRADFLADVAAVNVRAERGLMGLR